MSTQMKRRLIIVAIIIVVVLVALVIVVGNATNARIATVADVAGGAYDGKRVEVTGSVAAGTYEDTDDGIVFCIYDPDDDPDRQVAVTYGGSVAATFGTDMTAICTGMVGDDGTLTCTDLVTKCPSKYEDSAEALTVSQLLGYGDSIIDTTVKVAGGIQDGSLQDASSDVRFVLVDEADPTCTLAVRWEGALPDEVGGDLRLVLTGALAADGIFDTYELAFGE
ncbi:MAG: cytochrome c maturation protein CcmE [Coriobacteriaceae bacterium]|nr:cytochrome c maturation protein CcmE [Coriobacteriaceae bacterium]